MEISPGECQFCWTCRNLRFFGVFVRVLAQWWVLSKLPVRFKPWTFIFFSSRWLITPYRDNGHLTVHQWRFNKALSSIRPTIERAIGLLKGRWRKLLFLDHFDVKLEVNVIIAACVLHNFCLLHDDFEEGYILEGEHNDDHDAEEPPFPDGRANQKRTHLVNVVCGLWTSEKHAKHNNNTVYFSVNINSVLFNWPSV